MALAVAVPDRIGEAELDMVGHSAAHHGLMEIVAQRVVIGQALHVRSIAFEHVKELHGSGTFARANEVGRRKKIAGRRAIAAGADGYFNPRKQVVLAAARIFSGRRREVAIRLLPHLVEAVHRAIGIIVVGERRRRKLESALGQLQDVRNAGVGYNVGGQASATDGQVDIIGWPQLPGFDFLGLGQGWNVRVGGATRDHERVVAVKSFFRRADGIGASADCRVIDGAVLCRDASSWVPGFHPD